MNNNYICTYIYKYIYKYEFIHTHPGIKWEKNTHWEYVNKADRTAEARTTDMSIFKNLIETDNSWMGWVSGWYQVAWIESAFQ